MKKHKRGFTLAEVLITLVIIGIIAAMTIPTLMNKTNEQETVVAVKKAYSTLSQAYQRMIVENGEIYPENLGATQGEATVTLGEMFVKQLNVQKNCGVDTDGDCWGVVSFLDGSSSDFNVSTFYKFILADGFAVTVDGYPAYYVHGTETSLQNCIGFFNVDVNGNKGPNTIGKDVFSFYVTKYGIIPAGLHFDTTMPFSGCKTTGIGCTAWVVTKGNMDYLRKDISW